MRKGLIAAILAVLLSACAGGLTGTTHTAEDALLKGYRPTLAKKEIRFGSSFTYEQTPATEDRPEVITGEQRPSVAYGIRDDLEIGGSICMGADHSEWQGQMSAKREGSDELERAGMCSPELYGIYRFLELGPVEVSGLLSVGVPIAQGGIGDKGDATPGLGFVVDFNDIAKAVGSVYLRTPFDIGGDHTIGGATLGAVVPFGDRVAGSFFIRGEQIINEGDVRGAPIYVDTTSMSLNAALAISAGHVTIEPWVSHGIIGPGSTRNPHFAGGIRVILFTGTFGKRGS